jgi:stage III sporulation protein SpoIIIAA
MSLKHKISICVTRPDGGETTILRGGSRTLRSRLLNLLFGEKVGIIVMTPGETVENVEIKEIGGEACEQG